MPDDVEETGTLVLRSSNVKNGEIVDADNVYVNDKVVKSENVQKGDIIVVVRNGSRALIGKHAQIKVSMPNTVIGAFMSGMRSEHSSFVNALLDTSAFENEIAKNMGATINQITGYMFSKMEFMIPSGEEQKKIGEYFSNIDHLITLHQRKCEETRKLKKYMLQKMFSQNEKKFPEIRFQGFTEDWEQRKLGEMASSFEYGLNAAAKEYDGENKYIRITDIDDNTHEFLSDSLTSPDIDLTDAEKYKLSTGDILFARTGASVGKSYIYRDYDGLVYYAGFLIRARIKDEYDAEFVFQNTLTDKYNKYIAVTSQRSGQPGVNAQEYSEFKIQVPKKEEQIKIGKYFQNLDNLITLHHRKHKRDYNLKNSDWEQRKLDDVVEFLDTMRKPLEGAKRIAGPYPYYGASGIVDYVDGYLFNEELILLSEDGANITDRNYPICFLASGKYWVNNHAHVLRTKKGNENNFICNSNFAHEF